MSILEEITAHKRLEVEALQRSRPLAELRAGLRDLPPAKGLKFSEALSAPGVSLVAEIKKASPSRGLIRGDFDPAALASAYRKGGAAALSVLTDSKYFQGSDEHLETARRSCDLPILRKDFTISAYQVYQSRLLGADCVLLIVAALEQAALGDFVSLAAELGLDALVEVHDEGEAARAVEAGASLIGVNNRNLGTFEVSLETSARLAKMLPAGKLKISESGIGTYQDILTLGGLGYDAVLVGEHLMRQPDPAAAARKLMTGVSS
ncbi:MAG: indole-3-glycerol phosphate synthase TrpC [Candidatus Glassbacteria bacterium]|nr:indole-3-glycerol phosphate synthase TrpC [Candidatus Glassbacteria bacterium]